uniref:NADH-ubiquinone oxidoreductase chain 6 n=1 Tax=Brachyta interrogationis TaxID=1553375 RepID=A0A343C284_9CUCU|nr:NADH dehydrogenase subunit 6 [Brachyta interrogationis]
MLFTILSINLLSILFLFLNHPLSFGLILLIQTMMISLTTGMMNFNYWFSYILFLIMIGGMLILFIYMTSIASNEKFKFSYKMMLFIILMSSLLLLIMMLMDSFLINNNMNILELKNLNLNYSYECSMNKYLNWPSNLILFLIMIYLLITLIMVVKITNIEYGPLRQMI